MQRVKGLEPIFTPQSKILILGTFPSKESREKGEYYSNNRNRFWKVICECLGVPVPEKYEDKVQLLKDNGIALWDLIESCETDGSKDSEIKNPIKNDLSKVVNNTQLELVILNGKNTLKMLRKLYGASRIKLFKGAGYIFNYSTSAANRYFKKEQWTTLIGK